MTHLLSLEYLPQFRLILLVCLVPFVLLFLVVSPTDHELQVGRNYDSRALLYVHFLAQNRWSSTNVEWINEQMAAWIDGWMDGRKEGSQQAGQMAFWVTNPNNKIKSQQQQKMNLNMWIKIDGITTTAIPTVASTGTQHLLCARHTVYVYINMYVSALHIWKYSPLIQKQKESGHDDTHNNNNNNLYDLASFNSRNKFNPSLSAQPRIPANLKN